MNLVEESSDYGIVQRTVLISEPTNVRTISLSEVMQWRETIWGLRFLALAVATILIHGYHPLAEDGGLYVARALYTLDPSLFPGDAFIREQFHFSLFPSALAALVQFTKLPFSWLLLLVNGVTLLLTFYSCRQLLRRCIDDEASQLAALGLLAAWATLPVAGTSLLLIDPYVTARSVSTPLSVLALAYSLDDWSLAASGAGKSLLYCFFCLLASFLFHPLMAAYTLAYVLCLRASRLRNSLFVYALFAILAVALAESIALFAPAESPAAVAAAITRHYWFLSRWTWYEICGLVGPLAVLILLQRSPEPSFRLSPNPYDDARLRYNWGNLTRSSVALGTIAILIAAMFAHESSHNHVAARLQALRVFLPIYAVMTLLLGARLFEAVNSARRSSFSNAASAILAALPPATLLVIAAIMFFVQRGTFPASAHLELPWTNAFAARLSYPQNQWARAFLWARANTPRDALFALDHDYIITPGEDAQNFRATAERSALPDFSKDGGQASISPQLADLWQQRVTAELNLSSLPDDLRDARLLPLGVTWMVLRSHATTQHSCPYNNGTVKLCRLAR